MSGAFSTAHNRFAVSEPRDIVDYLDRLAGFGGKTAFRREGGEVSYAELAAHIGSIARRLAEEPPALVLLNCSDPFLYAMGILSCMLAGKTALLHDVSSYAIEEPFSHCGGYLVADDALLGKWLADARESVRAGCEKAWPAAAYDARRTCLVPCTSGSTGEAKGVALSQGNVFSDVAAGMRIREHRFDAVYLNVLPYWHMFGVAADLLAPLHAGATICLLENPYRLWSGVAHFDPTDMNLPPALAASLLDRLREGRFGADGFRLRRVLSAGAPLDPTVAGDLARCGVAVRQAYGVTECSPCVSIGGDGACPPESAGAPLDCNEVRLLENGEVSVRGSNVMRGYWRDGEGAVSALDDEGFFRTGDVGAFDDGGFLHIRGRLDDLVRLPSGKKVFAGDMERAICSLESVRDCAVYVRGSRLEVVAQAAEGHRGAYGPIEGRIRALLRGGYGMEASVRVGDRPLPKTSLGKKRALHE